MTDLRAAWSAAPRPAVVIEDAVDAAARAELRRRFETSGPETSWLAHRARCTRAALDPGSVGATLRAVAESVIGATLAIRTVEARRFDPGDYALLADDEEAPGFELCLDFSERPGARSAMVYCADRRPYLVMPQRPGVVALIHRAADTRRYMPYLQRFAQGPAPRAHLLVLGLIQRPGQPPGQP